MKKWKGKHAWLIFFFICFITDLSAQNTRQFRRGINAEKIYLHFDKPYYAAGETIWFKAYLYNNGLPSVLSHELNLQLENAEGKLIDKKIYPVAGSSAEGDIILDDSLPQGYYILKAATKANVNDGSGLFYSKNLFVYNSKATKNDSIPASKIYLQFFPESGHLINRIKTQVAFKATDDAGMPVELSGVIKSDTGTIILPFKTFHDGIGRISFTPHTGEKYFAEGRYGGKVFSFPLPRITSSGIYLKVSDADSGKIFEITRSKVNKELFDTISLLVKMNNDTVFINSIAFGYEETVRGFLKTGSIPSGILHFRVLNKAGVPLAERLSFVDNKEYINSSRLITLKKNISKRGLNRFECKFDDTLQHSVSISVTDENVQDFPDKENIYSRLLLTSDLKGYIYNPAFYFEKKDESTRLALDNLMLTHGWTRYSWEKKAPPGDTTMPGENDYLLVLSGMVRQEKNEQPVSNGSLNIIVIADDSTIQSFIISVKKDGRFRADSLLFFGNAKIYCTYNTDQGKQVPVKVAFDKNKDENIFNLLADDRNAPESPVTRDDQTETLNTHSDHPLKNLNDAQYNKSKMLAEVVLKTRISRPQDKLNQKYASFLYNSSGKLLLDNINQPYNNTSLSVIDYLLMSVQTIDVYNDENTLVNKKNFDLQNNIADRNDKVNAGMRYWPMAILLDERLSDLQTAKTITMDKVAMIKIYEAGFVGVGSSSPGGAIAVYLKKIDDMQPQKETAPAKYFSVNGYSVTQEFYSPDYSVSRTEHRAWDNRATLYWKTFTDEREKSIAFSFYNNDVSKRLRIIVEGFDAAGRLIHCEKIIEE